MVFCKRVVVRLVVYILLVTSIACRGGASNRDSSAATVVVGDGNAAGAIQEQSQGSLPSDYEKFTFSTYAEVTAADVVEIVLLVDSELAEEQKEKLAKGIDALLKHIINSNWNIAVADLEATAYPTKFITKYANYADYSKQFSAAIGVGKGAGETPDTEGQAPDADQLAGLNPRQPQAATLRVFIIVTAKSFSDTKLEESKVVIADEEDVHLTKVYAILNTEEGLDGFLNWKNEQDKSMINRYGSLQSDYKRVLEEFSADIANTLRGVFIAPSLPAGALQHRVGAGASNPAGEDVAIARIKVFNAPDEEEEQKGFIHDSHYQVKKNVIFTRAKFVEGVCVDITLEQ